MMGALCPLPYTIYRVKSCLQLLALSVLICSPNMSFLLDLFQTIPEVWENFSWGTIPGHPVRKKYLHGV